MHLADFSILAVLVWESHEVSCNLYFFKVPHVSLMWLLVELKGMDCPE